MFNESMSKVGQSFHLSEIPVVDESGLDQQSVLEDVTMQLPR